MNEFKNQHLLDVLESHRMKSASKTVGQAHFYFKKICSECLLN